jgi:SAM-dependent methyltransferase
VWELARSKFVDERLGTLASKHEEMSRDPTFEESRKEREEVPFRAAYALDPLHVENLHDATLARSSQRTAEWVGCLRTMRSTSVGGPVGDLRSYWTRTGSRERVTQIVEPIVRDMTGLVLDIGGGRRAQHDRAWNASVRRLRLDISMTHRPDVLGDAHALPFADGSFDGAVLIETLEHLPAPWIALEEIRRVLRDGGRLVGSVAFVYQIHGDPHDFYRYTSEGLRHLLRTWDDVTIVPHGNHLGAAWHLVASRSRALRALNPLFRNLGRSPDPRCPQGYVFTAGRR